MFTCRNNGNGALARPRNRPPATFAFPAPLRETNPPQTKKGGAEAPPLIRPPSGKAGYFLAGAAAAAPAAAGRVSLPPWLLR